MTKTVFIASAEPYTGKSIVALGLVNMLLGQARKIGYFKPIIDADPREKKDAHIETILSYFKLAVAYEDTYAYTRPEALRLMEADAQGEMIDTIIHKYKQLEENYDFTVVEGSDYVGPGTAFEFDANVSIAKNLGVPVIMVVSGEGKTTAQVISAALTTLRSFEAREVPVLLVVANKIKPEQVEDVRELLLGQLPHDMILAVIPEDVNLLHPTMREIHAALGGKLLFGEQQLANQVDNYVIGAMQVPNFLNYLKENVLIVTPGDRGDIIICALQANSSASYPRVAGIVLTAGSEPEAPIVRLIEGLPAVVPILAVPTGSFETTTRVAAIKSRIGPDNPKKIQLAISTFERYVDVRALEEKMVSYQPEGITPHMFQYRLLQWAKRKRQHIVLPEGNDDRILRAAALLLQQNVVDLTILGNPQEVAASAKRLGIQLPPNHLRVIDPVQSKYYSEYVQTFYELRKTKGVNEDMARDLMRDVSYFGSMMVHQGHANGMVSGAVHTTQHTIRPALQFIKTKPGVSVVSSVFFMCLPDRVAVFGDCAVNPNPTAEQLAEIAISSAESSQAFGIESRIAMLSYSSGTSGVGADVEKVRAATEFVRQKRPDLKVEGPIQYDAAVDPIVGRQKLPDSEVAGQASVLIFPDLNTGNNTYKAVQRETGALAIGPVLQGLNKPVNDLSRGCTVDDVFNTVVITAIQSQQG
ncbi:phosphate acetyltransferase [Hymenobacter taeanensis]|uniref:Phosphate acetyltransferase n=1 Tax=Hymenobacter taeanensis TaxID=2735321 RepID=A0A6M6BJW2_9BACT|nr:MULTISPECIES: phosphate acetyltransferase [Hymenobacter]QJX48259.1 phosphate acetyltransferase [Hymenobacter taeanensis]UOQ82259.1 phosphate acetyltransferase [Hymenobacter sp. 5414T-23]